jgi:hypothetical protein
MPRFGIVVPCFNNIDTVGEAIDSALRQRHADFAVYVSDNGSSDGSAERLAAYVDPRLKIALHANAIGKSANWNRAYALAAECDYLVTLHADDRLAPGALDALVKAAARRPALIHGRFRAIAQDGTPQPGRRFPFSYDCSDAEFRELLLLGNIVAVPGATIRADVFFAAGSWSPQWTYLQDVELWWRCGAFGPISYVGGCLGDYRAGRAPPGLPGQAAEHLVWQMEKLAAAPTARLRLAAIDGLSHQLGSVERALAAFPDQTPPPILNQTVERARQALEAGPRARAHAHRRQLGRRLIYAARTALAAPFLGSAHD